MRIIEPVNVTAINDTATSDWMVVLRTAVERSSITRVAEQIGYSRTAVSLALADKYQGNPAQIGQAVIANLSPRVLCPFLKVEIGPAECSDFASAPMPMSDAGKLKHWLACQSCALSPVRSSAQTEAVA